MSAEGLAAVRDHVVASSGVAARLAAIGDRDELFAAVVALGASIGAEVTLDDLAAASGAGARRAVERWR